MATLSRLEISEEEIPKRLKEFNEIIGYIEKLGELKTDQIEPTFQITKSDTERASPAANDEVKPSLPSEEVLKNSPASQDTFFLVPRVIDDEGK